MDTFHPGTEAGRHDISYDLSRVALTVLGPTVRRKVRCFHDPKREANDEHDPAQGAERAWSQEIPE
jgi:hypothetical protein